MYVSYALVGILESAPDKCRLPAGTLTSTALTFIVKAKTNIGIKVINFALMGGDAPKNNYGKYIVTSLLLRKKDLIYVRSFLSIFPY